MKTSFTALALSASIAFGNIEPLHNDISSYVKKVEKSVGHLMLGGKKDDFLAIFNPMNPDDIETDDGYIYLVENQTIKVKKNLNI